MTKSLGVVKLPGVENLPTVIVLGEMHVLPTTLRSAAGRKNPRTNSLPLSTNHTILFHIQKNWAVFHIKRSHGWLGTYTSLDRRGGGGGGQKGEDHRCFETAPP